MGGFSERGGEISEGGTFIGSNFLGENFWGAIFQGVIFWGSIFTEPLELYYLE